MFSHEGVDGGATRYNSGMELRGEAARWVLEMVTRPPTKRCQRIEMKRSVVRVPEGTETVSPPDTRSWPTKRSNALQSRFVTSSGAEIAFFGRGPVSPASGLPPASSATTTVLVPRLAVVKRNVQNDCLYHIVPLWRAPRSISSITLFRGSICALGLGSLVRFSADPPRPSLYFRSVHHLMSVPACRLTKVTQSRRSGLIFRPIIPGSDRSVLPFIVLSSNYGLGPFAHMGPSQPSRAVAHRVH